MRRANRHLDYRLHHHQLSAESLVGEWKEAVSQLNLAEQLELAIGSPEWIFDFGDWSWMRCRQSLCVESNSDLAWG